MKALASRSVTRDRVGIFAGGMGRVALAGCGRSLRGTELPSTGRSRELGLLSAGGVAAFVVPMEPPLAPQSVPLGKSASARDHAQYNMAASNKLVDTDAMRRPAASRLTSACRRSHAR